MITRLYFGRTMSETVKHGVNQVTTTSRISEDDFAEFINEVVVQDHKLYSFTLINGRGYWNGNHEQVTILEVFHQGDSHLTSINLNLIASIYKERFKQDTVLRVDTPANARFI